MDFDNFQQFAALAAAAVSDWELLLVGRHRKTKDIKIHGLTEVNDKTINDLDQAMRNVNQRDLAMVNVDNGIDLKIPEDDLEAIDMDDSFKLDAFLDAYDENEGIPDAEDTLAKETIDSLLEGLMKDSLSALEEMHELDQDMDIIDQFSNLAISTKTTDMAIPKQDSAQHQAGGAVESSIPSRKEKDKAIMDVQDESHVEEVLDSIRVTRSKKDVGRQMAMPIVESSAPSTSTKQKDIEKVEVKDNVGEVVNSELVGTDFLRSSGLSFNKKWGLLICDVCREGLSLRGMPNHLANQDHMQWNPITMAKDKVANHRPFPKLKPKQMTNFGNQIVESLKSEGHISSQDDILDAGKLQAWMDRLPELYPPQRAIEGVAVYDGFCCLTKNCTFVSRSEGTIRTHESKNKHKCTPLRPVRIQTFSEGFPNFYKVTEEPTINAKVFPSGEGELDPLQLLLQTKSALLPQNYTLRKVGSASETPALLPIFYNSGIERHLRKFDRATIKLEFPKLHSISKSTPKSFLLLRHCCIELFTSDLRLINGDDDKGVHHLIPHLVTNCTSSQKAHRRPFTALTKKKSITAYIFMEILFIWSLVHFYRSSMNDKQASPQWYILNDEHTAALQQVDEALKSDNIAKVKMALRCLFDAVYFPKKRGDEYRSTIYAYPIISFLVYQFVGEDGNYLPIHQLPPMLAKMQYCMRLRGVYKIDQLIGTQSSKDWPEITQTFCVENLQDFCSGPMSTIRYLMYNFSAIAFNTPHPPLIWWRDDTIILFGKEICFKHYVTCLREKFFELENLILDGVLFGCYTMKEIEAVFKIHETKDGGAETETILGYGVIADTTTNGLDTPESKQFFEAMFERKALELRSEDGRLIFNAKKGRAWIILIDQVWRLFFALSHLLVFSGRGTEAASMRPCNSILGRRNVIFDPGAQTGAYDTDYHKGQAINGQHKRVTRYLPYELHRLLHILHRIVRPIELFVICQAVVTEEVRPAVLSAYRDHVFASLGMAWTPETMSAALGEFFQSICGFRMGLHHTRHFLIGIQRQFINLSADVEETSPMEETMNKLRNHSKEVSDQVYARKVPLGSASEDERRRALILAERWHSLLQFPTSYKDVQERPDRVPSTEVSQEQTIEVKPQRKLKVEKKPKKVVQKVERVASGSRQSRRLNPKGEPGESEP